MAMLTLKVSFLFFCDPHEKDIPNRKKPFFCNLKDLPYTQHLLFINIVNTVAGFPVLFMYKLFMFKSHDFFECACNDERRQTL